MQLVEIGIREEFFIENPYEHFNNKAFNTYNTIIDNIQVYQEIENPKYHDNNAINLNFIKELPKIFTNTARYVKHSNEGWKLIRRGKFKLRPNTLY